MIAYDHDAFLAATRLVTALTEHGRDSDQYQTALRGVLAEYEVDGVIVALTDIACAWAAHRLPFFVAMLNRQSEDPENYDPVQEMARYLGETA